MAEPDRISALSGHLKGSSPRARAQAEVSLVEVRPRALVQIAGAPAPAELKTCLAAYALDGEPGPGRCVKGRQVQLLWTGPGRYLVVSEQGAPTLIQDLVAALEGQGAAVLDLSHARCVVRLQGPRSADVLAKGCPLDEDAMVGGQTALTMLSHFNILLHCDAREDFYIYVLRSFGLACAQWLLAAGREFGIVDVHHDGPRSSADAEGTS